MDATVVSLIFGPNVGITDKPINHNDTHTDWTYIFNRVVTTAPGGTGYFEVKNVEFPSLNKSYVTYKGDGIIQHAYVFYYALELDATQWFAISLVPQAELENVALIKGRMNQSLTFDRTIINQGLQNIYYDLSYLGYIAVEISPDIISSKAITLVKLEIDGILQNNTSSVHTVYPGQKLGLTYAIDVIQAKSGKDTMQLVVKDANYITCTVVNIITLSIDVNINDQVTSIVTMNTIVVY